MNSAPITDIALQRVDGNATALANQSGAMLQMVDLASGCGLTARVEGPQQQYRRLHARVLQVPGLPCEDSGAPSLVATIKAGFGGSGN